GEIGGSIRATPFREMLLVWSPQPGVLPSKRHIVEIATVADVGTTAVAEFQRLMRADRNRRRAANTRILQQGVGVFHAVQCGAATHPKIAVQRSPKPRFYIAA